jgi:hypothetical protein
VEFFLFETKAIRFSYVTLNIQKGANDKNAGTVQATVFCA